MVALRPAIPPPTDPPPPTDHTSALLVAPAQRHRHISALATPQLNICHSGVTSCYTGDAVMTRAVSVITSTKLQVLSVFAGVAVGALAIRRMCGKSSR